MTDPPFVVLLVAPDDSDRRLIGALIDAGGCELHPVDGLESALAAIEECPHDVVLLEGGLASEETVRQLLDEDPRAQVIVFGDPSNAEQVHAVRELGAVDHLPKATLDAATLQRAIRYAADHRRSVERLHHDALHDALTGLPNRRALAMELDRELARAARLGSPLAYALLDLDHFKEFNDSRGHNEGDRLLRHAARVWRTRVRAQDTVARWGGEEFALLLPDCGTDETVPLEIVERVRAATPYGQTASVGLAIWDGSESAAALTERADLALYAAKQAGRDRALAA